METMPYSKTETPNLIRLHGAQVAFKEPDQKIISMISDREAFEDHYSSRHQEVAYIIAAFPKEFARGDTSRMLISIMRRAINNLRLKHDKFIYVVSEAALSSFNKIEITETMDYLKFFKMVSNDNTVYYIGDYYGKLRGDGHASWRTNKNMTIIGTQMTRD